MINLLAACPPVYTLPGTWSNPETIAKCNDTLIPHGSFSGLSPSAQFAAIIGITLFIMVGIGVYKAFFDNQDLTDPWDEHDD
jgi:hypothetical protein|tara:strand:+ start:9432 stop:9677 length:246 start_codon:yes stop_codon:yes gene_type:complete